jgi:hypothetical protein
MQSGSAVRVAALNVDRTSDTGRAPAATAELRPGRAAVIVQPLVLDEARTADGFGDSNGLVGNLVHELDDANFALVGTGDSFVFAPGPIDEARHVAPVGTIGDEPPVDAVDDAGIVFRFDVPDILDHSKDAARLALDADVLSTVKAFLASPQVDALFDFANRPAPSVGWASAAGSGHDAPRSAAAADPVPSEAHDATEARSAAEGGAAAEAKPDASSIVSSEITQATSDSGSATEHPAGAVEGAAADRSIFAALADSAANAIRLVSGFVHTWDVTDVPAVEQWKGSASGNHGFLFGDRSNDETARAISWLEVNGNTVVEADVSGHATPDLQITLPGTHLNLHAKDFLL